MVYSILVVDDSMFMRSYLKNILIKNGHTVVAEASNGLEAIELYKLYSPDIVTMDITMDIMNGVDSTKEILEINKDAKIIMCSAMGQEHLIIESIRLGAVDYLVKPFNEDKVMEAINKLVLNMKG